MHIIGIQHKLTRVLHHKKQVNNIQEICIKHIMVMRIKHIMGLLELLDKQWSCQQHLVALCVPNKYQCTIH